MTDKLISSTYSAINNHIASRRLKPALDLLKKFITDSGFAVYLEEWQNLNDTYHSMLKYTVEGVFDPERQKIYLKLITSVYELNDQVFESLNLKFSSGYEFEKKRSYTREQGIFSAIHDLEKRLEATEFQENIEVYKDIQLTKIVKSLFFQIWITNKLTEEESQSLIKIFQNPSTPVVYRSFIISGLMLSLLRFFDQGKFMLLMDQCESADPETSQRALIGLLLNLHKYDKRLEFYPEINGRLKILFSAENRRHDFETIIKQLIRSKGTEKLQQRIREEFLPGIITISNNLKDKINLDSLMEEGLTEDGNPDWENILKDSPEVLHKMEEFSEMQMKGDDVLIGSFSMLKSFPFFHEADNWFIPFFPGNPEIADSSEPGDQQIGKIMEAINKAPFLCNSDKYSFCISIRNLPDENFKMISQAISAEMDQVKELSDDELLLNPEHKRELISNQVIQDLYRFYKLFPRKNDFEDIFLWDMKFHHKKALTFLFEEDNRIVRNIAEYYLSRDYFKEAAEIFNALKNDEKNVETWQKMGWCYQKAGDYQGALDSYLNSGLFGDINNWTLKQIAHCYRYLKMPDKALEYYQIAEKGDPENLGIQLNIGHCLLELKRYEEALKCYFKVEYLSPGSKKVWRPIGWCSFITGKKEQAEKYFTKLLEEDPGKHDFINMGHVKWSLGNRKAALENYLKSMTNEGFSEEKFLAIFEEDLPYLINQGIDKDDIPIMLDQLRYSLEA